MKPQDFMTLAEDLLKNRGKFSPELAEAIYRTALSRLYYGMLHWIQQRYRISVPTAKSSVYHAYVIEELEKIADDEVLIEFNFLKFKRIEADYLLEKVIESRDCQDCIVSKQKLLRLIEEHPQISFDGDAGDFKKRKVR